MPYEINRDEEEMARLVGSRWPSGISTGSAPSVTPAAGGAPAAPQGKFINFERYLSANGDAVARMGNQLTGQLEQEGTAAMGAVNAAVGRFDQGVNAATYTDRAQVAPAALPGADYRPYAAQGGTAVATKQSPGLASAPRGSISVEEAERRAGRTYAGPTEFTKDAGYQALDSQVQKAGSRVALTRDVAGLQALQGGIGYGGTLDAALLRTSAGGRLQGLRNKFGGLGKYFGDQGAAATGRATAARATTEGTADYYRGAVKGYGDNLKSTQDEQDAIRKAKEEQERRGVRVVAS